MDFLLQRVMDLDGTDQPHEYIYIDKPVVNLSKNRW